MTESSRLARAGSTLVACALSLSVLATGCSSTEEKGKVNPKASTFSFASPGGQLEITYPESERQPVGDISGPSLKDPATTIHLSDFDGKVVVLSAWGQWCGPCRTESDDLETIHNTIKDKGGTVLGINVRDFSEDIAHDFMVDNGLTYPSIYDPPFKTAAALGGVPASVIPTTVILDKKHRPAAVFLREITADEVLKVVLPLLDEK